MSAVLSQGGAGVGGAGKAHKEQAVSDGRRVSGTIRAPLMDNGAFHLESYSCLGGQDTVGKSGGRIHAASAAKAD